MIFMGFMNVLKKPWLNGYSSRDRTMCILVHWNKIGHSDSVKVQDFCKHVKNPPSRSSIHRWHKTFMGTRSVLNAVRSGRKRTSAENIESVRQAFSSFAVMNRRTWWWIFCILSPIASLSLNMYSGPAPSCVLLLSLNVRFCFNETGYKLCRLLRNQ